MRIASSGARRLPAGLVALLGATAMSATLAWAAPVPADRMDGVGAPAARLRDILRGYPLHTLDGSTVSLASLQGEVVVLNFWASWCSPCRKELPRLDALHAEISKNGARVLAVSIDHERQNVNRFARMHKLKLPIVHDGPDGLVRQLDLKHIPFTIVLDRNGEVAFTTSRCDDAGLDALAAATRQLIAGKPYASRIHEGDKP